MYCKNFCMYIILLFAAVTTVSIAQPVRMPDPNLRRTVNEHLNRPQNAQITRVDIATIVELRANDRGLTDLTGLEHMTNLRHLNLGGNNITDLAPLAGLTQLESLSIPVNPLSDLSPIAGLTRLTFLDGGNCKIVDLTPLRNLTKLVELQLNGNQIRDVRPLGGLSQLRTLDLHRNDISDVSPLAGLLQLTTLILNWNNLSDVTPLRHLTNLQVLEIQHNQITDHSPLDMLALDSYQYDENCEMAPEPLAPRLENRTYPSVFTAWGGKGWSSVINRNDLSGLEQMALHDMYFCCLIFDQRFVFTGSRWEIRPLKDSSHSIAVRDDYIERNPNMIFIAEIRMRDAYSGEFPIDSPYWLRDSLGKRIRAWEDYYLVDFIRPDVQQIIIDQAIAVDKCGLYDGIFLDWWSEFNSVLDGRDNEGEQRARDNIIREIRKHVRPDFLILVNTNIHPLARNAYGINGSFLETGIPGVYPSSPERLPEVLADLETTLSWLEQNLRHPVINALEGWGFPDEPPDSPLNRRWMRAVTTMSLTHSDGYVLFNDGLSHHHLWYDFWDADLGRPVGAKSQLYQETEGLYIREFTNGWAVYNHSGEAQIITLPEEAQGVASGRAGAEHTLPNLDGEMYLRVPAVNPADVNGDGVVNILDLILMAQAIGTEKSEPDVNGDGVINVFDLVMVAGAIGGGAAPSAHSLDPSIISAADVERWLAGAQGLGVINANFQRGIRFLEGLLAALTPKETTLLPNYPNPFNPETWIPYRLAREAEVAIAVYDTKGTLVRRLALGNQAAGYYAARGKAAYWDGRNEDGEAVASGIYIYQFRAGDYAASRRMVIVK